LSGEESAPLGAAFFEQEGLKHEADLEYMRYQSGIDSVLILL
jgi:hypothetical protein